jgi:hypothetical protein
MAAGFLSTAQDALEVYLFSEPDDVGRCGQPLAKRRDGLINGREHGVWPDAGALPMGRVHPVSTITVFTSDRTAASGAPKDSHDVVPVIRSGGSPVGLLSMATCLVTEHLADGLISPTGSPFFAVSTSS